MCPDTCTSPRSGMEALALTEPGSLRDTEPGMGRVMVRELIFLFSTP